MVISIKDALANISMYLATRCFWHNIIILIYTCTLYQLVYYSKYRHTHVLDYTVSGVPIKIILN